MHPLGLGFRPATLKSLSRTQITGCMSLPHDTVLSRRPGAVFANQKQRQGAAVLLMSGRHHGADCNEEMWGSWQGACTMCCRCHTSCNSIVACVRQESSLRCPTDFVCRRTYEWCKCRVACACGEPAYHAWQLLLLLATNQVHQWACQCCGQLAVSNCHAVPNLRCATSASIFRLSAQQLLSHSRTHCTAERTAHPVASLVRTMARQHKE